MLLPATPVLMWSMLLLGLLVLMVAYAGNRFINNTIALAFLWATIIRRYQYQHPVLTCATMAAQWRH